MIPPKLFGQISLIYWKLYPNSDVSLRFIHIQWETFGHDLNPDKNCSVGRSWHVLGELSIKSPGKLYEIGHESRTS